MGKPTTSCDNCRRSRIGCDAHLQPGQTCSNCVRKGLKCTRSGDLRNPRQWRASKESSVRSVGRLPAREAPLAEHHAELEFDGILLQNSTPLPPTALPSPLNLCDTIARSQQALELHNILWNVFKSILEPRISLWISGAGCPFSHSITVCEVD